MSILPSNTDNVDNTLNNSFILQTNKLVKEEVIKPILNSSILAQKEKNSNRIDNNDYRIGLKRVGLLAQKEGINDPFLRYWFKEKKPAWHQNPIKDKKEGKRTGDYRYLRLQDIVDDKIGLCGYGLLHEDLVKIDIDYIAGIEEAIKLGVDFEDDTAIIGWSSGSLCKDAHLEKYKDAKIKTKRTIIFKICDVFREFFELENKTSITIFIDGKEIFEIKRGDPQRIKRSGAVQIPSLNPHQETGKLYYWLNDLSKVEKLPTFPNPEKLREFLQNYLTTKKPTDKRAPERIQQTKERYKAFLDGEIAVSDLTLSELEKFVYEPKLGLLTANQLESLRIIDPRHDFKIGYNQLAGNPFYTTSQSKKSFHFYQSRCEITGKLNWLWIDQGDRLRTRKGGGLFSYYLNIIRGVNYSKEYYRKAFEIFQEAIKDKLGIDLWLPKEDKEIIGKPVARFPKQDDENEITQEEFENGCNVYEYFYQHRPLTVVCKSNKDIFRLVAKMQKTDHKQMVMITSQTGSGKTEVLKFLNPEDLNVKYIVVCTPDFLNSELRKYGYVIKPSRHRGTVKLKNGVLRRFKKDDPSFDGKPLVEPPSCQKMDEIDKIRELGEDVSNFCESCNLYDSCTYQHEKEAYKEAKKRLICPTQLVPHLPYDNGKNEDESYDPKDAELLIDENFPKTVTTKITIAEFLADRDEVLKICEETGIDPNPLIEISNIIHELREETLPKKKDINYFGVSADKFKLNIFNEWFTEWEEFYRDNLIYIRSILDKRYKDQKIQSKISKLYSREKNDSVRKKEIAKLNLKKPNYFLDVILQVGGYSLDTDSPYADQGCIYLDRQGDIVLTRMNEQLLFAIKQFKSLVYMDATANKKATCYTLKRSPHNVTVFKTKEVETTNLKYVYIRDCKGFGINRSFAQRQKKEDGVKFINKKPKSLIVDKKLYTNPKAENEIAFHSDTVGNNNHKDKLNMLMVGAPMKNINQLIADYITIFNRVPIIEEKKDKPTEEIIIKATNCTMKYKRKVYSDKDLQDFIDQETYASIIQTIGRLRANLRLNEELTVFIMGNYYECYGDNPNLEIKRLSELTGIIHNKQHLRILKTLKYAKQMIDLNMKINYSTIADYMTKKRYKSNKMQVSRDFQDLLSHKYSEINLEYKTLIEQLNQYKFFEGKLASDPSNINSIITPKNLKTKLNTNHDFKSLIDINSIETREELITKLYSNDSNVEIDDSPEDTQEYLNIDIHKVNKFESKLPEVGEFIRKNISWLGKKWITEFMKIIFNKFSPEDLTKAIPDNNDSLKKGYQLTSQKLNLATTGGLHKDASETDIKGAYPNIMINHSLTNRKDSKNLMLETILVLLDMRKEAKLKGDTVTEEQIKELTNSIYGWLGTPSNPLNDYGTFRKIRIYTYKTMKEAIAIIENECNILSVTTDSFKFNEADPTYINQLIKDKLNVPSIFNLTFANKQLFFVAKTDDNKANHSSFLVLDNDYNVVKNKGDFNTTTTPIKGEFAIKFTQLALTKSSQDAINYYYDFKQSIKNEDTLKIINQAYKSISNTLNLPQNQQNIA